MLNHLDKMQDAKKNIGIQMKLESEKYTHIRMVFCYLFWRV